MNKWVSFLFVLCFYFIVSVPPISDAQTAMDRGMAAAKQKEWELAIKYFTEAQKAAPTSPKALFNLALAYDSAGGRELITIAWYRAYLAAMPDAANAKQVEKRLLELEIKVEATIGKLIREAMKATARLPEENSKREAYAAIAEVQAKAGDIAGVKETVERIKSDYYKSRVYNDIVKVQVKAGDIAGALEIAPHITSEDSYKTEVSKVYYKIAEAQVEAGDMAGARNSLAKAKEAAAYITADYYKSLYYSKIAYTQAKAGDIAGARNSITKAKEIAARMTTASLEHHLYRSIAKAQVEAGDIAEARDSFAQARDAVARITNDTDKSRAYGGIAEAQAKAGDIAGAKETAARITDDTYKTLYYTVIHNPQDMAGDKTGTKAGGKTWTKRISAATKVQSKPIELWTKEKLKDPLFVDLQGHIQSLTAKKPLDMVKSLADAAGKMADALFELKSKSPQ